MKRGAIVLCGGRSRRMGLPKAMLPFGPEVMLQRVVRLVGEVAETIVVVAARQQQLPELPEAVRVVRDEREGRGPLEGLAVGLRTIAGEIDAVYATGCDAPRLVPGFVRRMFELLNGHEIAVPREGEFYHPLAGVYRASVLVKIETLLAADRMRPVFLFDLADTLAVPVEMLQDVDPELATLDNLNEPHDYVAAIRQAGFEVPADVLAALQLQRGE